ncbi:MAG: hypothetical protein K9H84_05880 [Bacteroidales bacterium]|nr:hypothetical protein [Bacteroidales bacterium]
MNVSTLKQFIKLIEQTIPARKNLVLNYLNNTFNFQQDIYLLKETLSKIAQIPQENNNFVLRLNDGNILRMEAEYEVDELKKDIYFFEHQYNNFITYLSKTHTDFDQEVKAGTEFLQSRNIQNFITDRDGTVNNYCARYNTSVQSAYNAVFLSNFSRTVQHAVLLTSAPLKNKGLFDISVLPDKAFILAGSKGREFIDINGTSGNFPIQEEKKNILRKFNNELSELLLNREYSAFARIGSGLQYKFGQTTIARQDINQSIDLQKSTDFLDIIKGLVHKTDPEEKHLAIEDTGLDIEVILTVESANENSVKDFNKGHGLEFLNKALKLNLHEGSNLICGDTNSDVPMVEKSRELNTSTSAIFVTREKTLKDKVKSICPDSYFVSSPDILVTILNQISNH